MTYFGTLHQNSLERCAQEVRDLDRAPNGDRLAAGWELIEMRAGSAFWLCSRQWLSFPGQWSTEALRGA
jgi:hypothetical protein